MNLSIDLTAGLEGSQGSSLDVDEGPLLSIVT